MYAGDGETKSLAFHFRAVETFGQLSPGNQHPPGIEQVGINLHVTVVGGGKSGVQHRGISFLLDGHKLPLVRPLDVLELDLKSPLDSPSLITF